MLIQELSGCHVLLCKRPPQLQNIVKLSCIEVKGRGLLFQFELTEYLSN